MNDVSLSAPVVSRKSHIAPIWLLPFIALLVGIWLVWRSLLDIGPTITIEFESGDGIVANQTQVKYKGITIGTVKQLRNKDDLSGVIVEVEMDKSLKKKRGGVPREAQFWLVQPQVSLAGISGLNTLLSGNYIGAQLSTDGGKLSGESAEHFIALKAPPPLPASVPGLHIRFKTDRLGSLGMGAPVFSRQIPVGSVQSAGMAADGSGVEIGVFIEPQYAGMVRKNTRFWNASGLQMNAGLGGIHIEVESMVSLLAGGISMSLPDEKAPLAENGDGFFLYKDFEAADTSVYVNIQFASAEGLTKDVTKVMYKNMVVGKLRDVWFDKTRDAVFGRFGIDPRFQSFINDQTRFWLVKPEFSAAGVSGLDALLSGSYLTFSVNEKGNPVEDHNFVAAAGPDPKDYFSAPGLHLRLVSSTAQAPVGSPVYFNNFVVGVVENRLLEGDEIATYVLIKPDYRHLVNGSSRFWNVSGMSIDASLSKGIQISSAPLAALIAGGIAFDTPRKEKSDLHDGAVFKLQISESSAKAVSMGGLPGTYLTLEAPDAGGIRIGAPVLHKDIPVGSVQELRYSDNGKQVQILINIETGYNKLLSSSTRFWRSSAVDVKVGGGGVNMRVGSLAQMIDGGIAFDSFADKGQSAGSPVGKGDRFMLFSSKDEANNAGVTVHLQLTDAKSLNTGSEIRYRGLPIGAITRLQLSENLQSVNAEAALKNDALPMLNSGTHFWKVSPSVGLARTDNLDALLGSYLELRPGKGNPVRDFVVTEQEPVVTAFESGLNLLLTAPQLGSLKAGDPVLYRQVKVGEVLGGELSTDGEKVNIYINIWPQNAQLVRSNSRFWNASGITVEAGLFSGVDIRTESAETVLSGGVAFDTPDKSGAVVKDGKCFALKDKP
ncbi:MAG TPA: MlaD family protein [Pseudomonadales bacterium]|nr:MlaD family protein [Pseudomonadales bacterium]